MPLPSSALNRNGRPPPPDRSGGGPIVDVVGAQFDNKGAELMLRTVMRVVRSRIPEARFALSLNCGSPRERRALGLMDVVSRPSRIPLLSAAHAGLARFFAALPTTRGELMPDMRPAGRAAALRNWLRSAMAARSVHSVLPDRVDAVLDVSGFFYSDAWLGERAEPLILYYRQVKRKGGRVVLLPQTYGPFEKAASRSTFLEVYEIADLVYARDEESFRRAAALVPDPGKLRQAPDITTHRSGTGAGAGWAEGKACVIPNARMTTHVEAGAAAAYVPFLRRVLSILRELEVPAFMLVHESGGDEEVARKALEGMDDVELVIESDAFRIKEIIGRSRIAVSSRLHGLINALSQGVPSLATSWAHKYPALMKEYGVGEFLVDPAAPDEKIRALLKRLLDPDSRPAIVATLQAAEAERVRKVDAMWDEVIPLLSRGS